MVSAQYDNTTGVMAGSSGVNPLNNTTMTASGMSL